MKPMTCTDLARFIHLTARSSIGRSMATGSEEGESLFSDAIDSLLRAFSSRLVGVMLFGSRARGDYKPWSDYDFLIVLEEASFDQRLYPLHHLPRDIHQVVGPYSRYEH